MSFRADIAATQSAALRIRDRTLWLHIALRTTFLVGHNQMPQEFMLQKAKRARQDPSVVANSVQNVSLLRAPKGQSEPEPLLETTMSTLKKPGSRFRD